MIEKNWIWFHDHFGKGEEHHHAITRFIAQVDTPFQHVEIGISPYFGKMIIIDGDVQSSVVDEHVYHELIVHPALFSHPNPKSILILGGGEGATLREILKHKTVEHVVMCDIDRQAVDLFKTHLPEWHQNSFYDPRVELIHGDARAYLEKAPDGEFDVIISDLTEPYSGGPSQRLFSVECYEEMARVTGPDGVYSAQGSLLRLQTYEVHLVIKTTCQTAFPYARSCAGYIQSYDTPWSFITATKKQIPPIDNRIDELIAERINGDLKFYDQEAHNHAFSLPKDIRALLSKKIDPITDSKPFSRESKSIDM
ncbi:MAG TPA: methyltransferase domain-containing protein [Caldisericia bacterium]|nr:methyltransferase domain-containing protein [Caldisericia bacterium]HNY60895.1 methyltransferase domain-containing protein [Caldisericia bacterium]HOC79818.1 methyltransferase domain-containing protein [Caldisericia bacterium]HOG69936.1 methyltransferase domain-containing protein [Caldisericia bacterium]HPA65421.1 methyltransferase domain-containing protein [Caldisericia bacterium]